MNSNQENPGDIKHPKIGFVIVNKRTNARFVTVTARGGSGVQYDNPQPGTIVDDVITLPER